MRRNKDLWGIGAALLLLLLSAVWYLWSSRSARVRREAVAATVPEFPRPGQPAAQRRRSAPSSPRAPEETRPAMPARTDALNAFVLAPGASTAGVISVNALLNTPLFARIRECMGKEFADLEKAAREVGVELDRDIDRVGMVPYGMAVSGFFEGKPVVERMMTRAGAGAPRDYQGAQIYEAGDQCTAQLGNLVLLGRRGHCEELVDRSRVAPQGDAAQDIYGDVWARTDLTAVKEMPEDPQVRQLLEAMKTVTVRANVWDSVALSLEGLPRGGHDANELIRMARGAISLAKTQIDEEDVELAALAEMAHVEAAGNGLQIDLAVPAKDLFDRLRLPCPGRADAGP